MVCLLTSGVWSCNTGGLTLKFQLKKLGVGERGEGLGLRKEVEDIY